MLTYEQALKRILAATPSPRTAVVRLNESLGLVLARPIMARCDLPQFDNSAVDGYAIRSHDAAHATFYVVGKAEAGRPFGALVRQGEAVRILTGAQVPQGADAVVMQEHAIQRHRQLVIQRWSHPLSAAAGRCRARNAGWPAATRQGVGWPTPGQNIRRRGEDLRQGTRVLEAGTGLRPQDIGLLAALGVAQVAVYPRPTVAILTTGDELTSPGRRLKPGQIYESNGPLLRALVQQGGAQAIDLGTARDAIASLVHKVRLGLACNLLVISGGVSVGERDFVRQAARRCGVSTVFWRVNIKPGMPVFFGKRGRTLVFGLPGNPVSVFVTFQEFVKPALYRLMGRGWQDPYTEPAILTDALRISHTRRTHFIRVRCCATDGQWQVAPVNGQGSHRLRSLIEADGWIRVTADQEPWPAGTHVLVKPEANRW